MGDIIFSQSSGVNNSVFGKSQAPIRAMIESKAEAHEKQSIINQIFSRTKSENFGEKIASMTAMNGFLPVGENGAYPNAGMQEGYSKFLEHTTFKNQFAISMEMIQDNKMLDLKGRPSSFIKSFYRTQEDYGAALFGGAMKGDKEVVFGGKKFDITGADGLPLFHKEHPSSIEGVGLRQSNKFANAFSVDALGMIESEMQNFKGDNEELLAVAPNTIIIPNDHALKKAVFEAIGADKDPATANNGFNYQFGRWTVIVWAYLNKYVTKNTKPYILMDTDYNEENYGAVWFDRTDLSVHSYIDENTDANIHKGNARFVAGFNDWRAFAIGGISGGTTLS